MSLAATARALARFARWFSRFAFCPSSVERATSRPASADPYKGEVFVGSIARVVHSLDPRSRTMGIEVEIPNPRAQLKPGMFARVDAVVETRKAVLTVPLETLRVGEGPPIVMLVRNNAVEAVQVQLGAADQKDIEIVKGVGERDQVILQGKDLVRTGQKVRTVAAGSGQ